MDNVLVSYEYIHAIKNKRACKNGLHVVKLDMHKACDRVEFEFLKNMMIKLGFHDKVGQYDDGLCIFSELLYPV